MTKQARYLLSVFVITVALGGLGYLRELDSAVIPPAPETSKPLAYVASPLGFSEAGRYFYERTLLPLVREAGFQVLDPWSLTPQALIDAVVALPYGEEKRARWRQLNQIIGHNNADAIRKCDLVIAVLDGSDVDSGTASEVGFAAALGKSIIGYRGDFRLSADNEGSLVNLQVEYFIRLRDGVVVNSTQHLRDALRKRRELRSGKT